jgi:NhaP-type Na+/H+ or K+/H+ antiporter
MLTEDEIYVAFAAIAIFGIGGQWIGRRFGFPSLLVLLPAGLLAGDVLGLVKPEELFGDLLFPLVTLLVSLLLFESGLGLRFAELPVDARSPVIRLLTIGLVITFLGASLASLAILDLDVQLAFLLGAIIVVSGPTVVGPLLSSVRARAPIDSVLNYEGSFLDPLGATLGVVVLSVVLAEDGSDVHPVVQALATLTVGVAVGLVAAVALVFVMSRFWLTFNMESAVAVMFAVAAFAAAEVLLSEAGLFATLTMGVAVANQRRVSLRPVRIFGGTLEVLVIGMLFILLGALVTIDGLREYAWQIVLLVTALVLVVRPLTTFVALLGTSLGWRDRALVGSIDPRGIVAASTAASFTGSLAAANLESDFLLPVVFGVILGTGVIYGLAAKPLARLLGVVRPPAKGVGFIGNAPWLLDLAGQLQELAVSVLVVTAKSPELAQADATRSGVPVLSLLDTRTRIVDAVQKADIYQAALCAPSSEALRLLDTHLINTMGRRRTLRLPDRQSTDTLGRHAIRDRSAHPFTPGVTLQEIDSRVAAGAVVKVIRQPPGDTVIPLAAVSPDGTVNLQPGYSAPGAGDTVIALVGGSSNIQEST